MSNSAGDAPAERKRTMDYGIYKGGNKEWYGGKLQNGQPTRDGEWFRTRREAQEHADSEAAESSRHTHEYNRDMCAAHGVDTPEDIATLEEMQDVYGGGVVTNDRGQGSGGPNYLSESEIADMPETPVEQVSEADDPEAWELARYAHEACELGAPVIVCVGEPDAQRDNPHQIIYSV